MYTLVARALRPLLTIARPSLALAAGLSLCAAVSAQDAPRSPTPEPLPLPAQVTSVAQGLEHPWGLALLPDGSMLVTERPGRLRRVSAEGKLSAPLTGVPADFARGQGGLLDVTLSPDFAKDRLVYLGDLSRAIA